jgi:alpha-D-xyloside xylohydrolase
MPHRTLTSWLAIAALATLALGTAGCSDPVDPPPDGGSDADPDADTDPDAGADADADGDGGAPCDSGDGPARLDLGAGVVLAVEADGSLRLLRGEAEVLRLPPEAFAVGTVARLDPAANYDPYYLEDVDRGIYREPAGLAWLDPACASTATDEGGALVVTLTYPGGRRGSVTLRADAPGRARVDWTLPDGDPPAVFARLAARTPADEHFYGLGEVFDHVDHRGRVRAMQLEPAPLESANNEAHVPIPLLVGTSGWGLYVDSRRPGVFATAVAEDDLVRVTYGLGAAAGDGLALYLFAEPHPLDVTRHYYELTGFPGPVAPWALGPWLWRDEVDDQAAVEADLATIRDLDLATTGYWIDRPYASAVNSFDFEPADYPDPAAMMAAALDLGFRVALWHTPYLDDEDADSRALYDAAVTSGYFPPVMGTAASPWGPPLDFTNPDAFAWWQARLAGYRDLGVAGYKLDYAEEVLAGAFGIRLPWAFYDGSDELTMHRGYQDGYHRAYAEMLPEGGGFLLCRAAVAGDQRHGTIIWPGDIDATLTRFGEAFVDRDGEEHVGVGGLPAAVVASSALGPSGFPLFGSDTGGYRHAPPDRETYVRWFEHTALSTVMQVGTNANDLPWDLGDLGLDEEVLDLYRRYARLHLRLFPYLWSAFARVRVDGRAIQRPLGLAHPELGLHPDDVYLLGDHLLVAPVVDRGVTQRRLSLPAGGWQDWWTGAHHEGEATVAAPLGTIPLLVREWAPIPLLRPTIDTLLPVADPAAVDSFATAPGPLWVRLGVRAGSTGEAAVSAVLYDGTELAVEPPATGGACPAATVRVARGEVFAGPVVFEVVGAELDAPRWSAAGGGETSLAASADAAAFDAAEAGWLSLGEGRTLSKAPGAAAAVRFGVCGG